MAYGEFAKIYDELINEDINYDEMCKFILSICNKLNVSMDNYLDLACGTGSVTVRLGKHFKDIYGVDLSEDMLREAFDKLRENKVRGKIICQDMSELNLNKKFNLITSVLDATNYITEYNVLINYFKSVNKHLEDNGIFIFDINSYYKLSEVLGDNIYTYNSEDVFYSWENTFEDNIVSMFLTFFVKTSNGLYERFEEEHLEKAYTEDFIDDLLDQCGFELINKYDGYTTSNVQAKSERIVYIVKKK